MLWQEKLSSRRLTVSTKGQRVVLLPVTTPVLLRSVALVDTTRLLANRRETTLSTSLVHRVADPRDTWVATDSLVRWVHKNNLKELVSSVLVDPVRVEHTQIGATLRDTLFSSHTQRTLVLEVVDTHVCGFTHRCSLWCWLLATTTTHANTVNDISLLRLVPQTTCLVWSRRTRSTVNDRKLSVFPASHTEQETENVRLLLLVELLEVFV